MPKAQFLCTLVPNQISEFGVKGKRIALLLCQPKEDTAGSCLKKLCDLLREDNEKFRSNGSKRE